MAVVKRSIENESSRRLIEWQEAGRRVTVFWAQYIDILCFYSLATTQLLNKIQYKIHAIPNSAKKEYKSRVIHVCVCVLLKVL